MLAELIAANQPCVALTGAGDRTESEAARVLDTVITQNVDGLHAAAGSRDVIDAHAALVVHASAGETLRRLCA
jgi:NAD-dependent SIR2 family protein deacetylase